ncbi:MAG: ATP-binding protein, partial [Bacillota bacterium]|nr:ATP-binding protein [Bacillota bacterium]
AAEFSRELEETLKKMRYSSLCEMLSIYPEYVQRLAGRLEKSIVPFNIECSQDIRVDAEKNEEFIRSLVHVFRNAVDHGIESYEERAAQNKEMDGRICCSVQKVNHGFKILISDDGRGIDAEAVKQAALKNQLITRQEAENTSLEDSVMLIFKDGVTTAAGNKGLSGRGEGLASVKMQTELLGGTVEVNSKPGRGTVFVFNIPEQD